MGLLEIIIFSLKLFILTSAIVILLSYVIYKVKDRKRIKPYMHPAHIEPIAIEIKPQVQREENPNPINKRYQILNEEEQIFQDRPVAKVKPLNDINISPIDYKGKNNLNEEKFNIYNHYSNKSIEPMHKIKTD